MPRFTQNTDPATLRATLIDEAIDDLTPDLIEDIIQAYPAAFGFLARLYLEKRWANAADVWDEAADRGYFTADHDD